MNARLRAIIRYRRVLWELIRRDLKVKYERSLLGWFWSLLEPLLLTLVYFIVFSVIARFGIEDYPLFLISALLPWLWFSTAVTAGAKAVTSQARLITKVYMPREILPLAVVGAKGFEYLASLPVLALFAVILQRSPSVFLLALPLAIFLQAVLLVGIVMLLSSINALMRDVERLVRVGLRFLFYASPVIYSLQIALDRFPSWGDVVYRLNPLVGILELSRAVWFPDVFVSWLDVGISAVGATVLLAVGWATFVKLEPVVLKEL